MGWQGVQRSTREPHNGEIRNPPAQPCSTCCSILQALGAIPTLSSQTWGQLQGISASQGGDTKVCRDTDKRGASQRPPAQRDHGQNTPPAYLV